MSSDPKQNGGWGRISSYHNDHKLHEESNLIILVADLRNRSPHGLRKAAGRRLAEAGWSAHQMISILGDKTRDEAECYTWTVSHEHMAIGAMNAKSQEKICDYLPNQKTLGGGNKTVTKSTKNSRPSTFPFWGKS